MSEPIGRWLWQQRRARGMSQREVSSRVGVGFPYISKLEHDICTPSNEVLCRYAELFAVDPDELLLRAGRLSEEMLARLATDPAGAVQYLRAWKTPDERQADGESEPMNVGSDRSS
jgi:transcriptional regulator with XRE-family HTH domain